MAGNKRRKRRNRRMKALRTVRRVIQWLLVSALLLALGGLGVWMLWEEKPQTTVVECTVAYEDFIRRYAQENGIPPAFVASVIMAESSYRPDVVSSVNAQGLMQILPSTGNWIAGKFDETYTEGCLFDPETNIRYGCWYLGFLMERYDGDLRSAAAAYHQGQGRVDDWLDDPQYSTDGKKLDRIPSEATEKYVNRILRYYQEYEKVYA